MKGYRRDLLVLLKTIEIVRSECSRSIVLFENRLSGSGNHRDLTVAVVRIVLWLMFVGGGRRCCCRGMSVHLKNRRRNL